MQFSHKELAATMHAQCAKRSPAPCDSRLQDSQTMAGDFARKDSTAHYFKTPVCRDDAYGLCLDQVARKDSAGLSCRDQATGLLCKSWTGHVLSGKKEHLCRNTRCGAEADHFSGSWQAQGNPTTWVGVDAVELGRHD